MEDLRVIFMGTPEFAVPSLEILAKNGVNVVAVVTAPDKPRGRGQKIAYSPVKEAAIRYNVPVLQPANLKAPEFIEQLKSYRPHLQVVVAFRMLPEAVWSFPEIGTFNLHASLLPDYRGAAPINWAIINGEKQTGVTTFFLQHEIDTGAIIFQESVAITPDDTAGSLYERLMDRGAQLVLKTVKSIAEGKYQSIPQSHHPDAPLAPKIFRDTCAIDWNKPSEAVRNFVRGLSPYPAAWATFNGTTYKIFKVQPVAHGESKMPGEFSTDNKSYLFVKTGDGWISVEEWQPEGKKRMPIGEFFRGNKL